MHKELAHGTAEIENEKWRQLWHLIFQECDKKKMQRSAGPPTGRGYKAAPSSSNLMIYRTATPWPLLYCQNRIPPALQTTDDPTGKLPKQSERVLCRPMDKGICNGDHLPGNQSLPKIALHPMEPAASQETWISGMRARRGDNRKLYLFHDWKNSSHHDKSKWNSLLTLIGWSSLWKAASRLREHRDPLYARKGQLTIASFTDMPILTLTQRPATGTTAPGSTILNGVEGMLGWEVWWGWGMGQRSGTRCQLTSNGAGCKSVEVI